MLNLVKMLSQIVSIWLIAMIRGYDEKYKYSTLIYLSTEHGDFYER